MKYDSLILISQWAKSPKNTVPYSQKYTPTDFFLAIFPTDLDL